LDDVFRALADRTRRRLLARLAESPATITELAAPFEMTLPAVAKHIGVLERARLVIRTPAVDGREHRCALAASRMREATVWLDTYRAFWDDTLAALARFVERG
jgi:DNA-binding transcriptional ArsR family regulator